MGQPIEIRVPDIGDFEEVEVVELLVAKGDEVAFDDPLISVESDKATMEIPSPSAGVVAEVRVAEGDRVSEGSVLVLLNAAGDVASEDAEPAADPDPNEEPVSAAAPPAEIPSPPAETQPAGNRCRV